MTLWAIIATVAVFAASVIAAAVMGGSRKQALMEAEEDRRRADTYQKSMEARNAVNDLSDDAVLDRLRDRAER